MTTVSTGYIGCSGEYIRPVTVEMCASEWERRFGGVVDCDPTDHSSVTQVIPRESAEEFATRVAGIPAGVIDAGPGADKFNKYREAHGKEPCPGTKCTATHGGGIATRATVTVAPI